MTTVEVLAPIRLVTRFVPPEERDDGVNEWKLQVRVYPDEFSIRRTVPAPTPAELDRLTELVAAMFADPPAVRLDEVAAFATFGAAVGAGRALGLWRTRVQPDGAGGLRVDRTGEADQLTFQIHGPAGLPEKLELWLVLADGSRQLAAVLEPQLVEIGRDLNRAVFDDSPELPTGALPETWWLSFDRALAVGLGIELDVGLVPPALSALVVVGIGSADAAELVDEHSAGSRLAVLPPGTPTNTIAGEPTTDLGQNAETLYPLLHLDASTQPSAAAVLTALTGRVSESALPMLNGAAANLAAGAVAVQGFWPVLWGRALRDVTGAGDAEQAIADWAVSNLAVEGPRPAFRVGSQPYGLLPTSAFEHWVDDPADGLAGVEEQIRRWALPWRAGAAAAALATDNRVHDADTTGLLDVYGGHAPSRYWDVRPIADLPLVQAWHAMAGMPGLPAGEWDRFTASALRGWPYPVAPIGPAAHAGPIPGPPRDEQDDAGLLSELCQMPPEELYHLQGLTLGLLGHLVREAMICARAVVGEAANRHGSGKPVVLGARLPLDNEDLYRDHVMQGTDQAVEMLAASGDPAAMIVAERFSAVPKALRELVDRWQADPTPIFRATLAAMDTAAFRVDPWLTGIAERRLQAMIADGAPFRLGAYGWVDAPAPYGGPGASPAALAPGPTAAGLLHAPSAAQALTAAVLRDAAVRNPTDGHWKLEIDSAKVRVAMAFAERVRLGVHPYEALGLEVEKIVGDWDLVRILRQRYALADDQQERRVCDGVKVLDAVRGPGLGPEFPPDLADRLRPLDHVMDTYADLLMADGVYAIVTGRADLANAAMEAAAGLGEPPELRAMRTPRAASTVRVSAWAVLPPGDAGAGDPLTAADPAYAALLAGLPDTGDEFAILLGGGEDESVVPALTGGVDEGFGETDNNNLRAAMLADLDRRLTDLRTLAGTESAAAAVIPSADPGLADAIRAAALRWAIDLAGTQPADPAGTVPTGADLQAVLLTTFADRLARTATMPAAGGAGPGAGRAVPDSAVNARRQAIRTLSGRPTLPVLPIVNAALLPVARLTPGLDQSWLEIVAAVRPRLAPLEAHQFDPDRAAWSAAVAAPAGSVDPWHQRGPVLVVYGPQLPPAGPVAIAALDAWTDSIPSRRHATTAAFGFNGPKSRPPQAVLLAVPPDRSTRLDNAGLLDVVLETRELVQARAARPQDRAGLPYATPGPLVHANPAQIGFLNGWPP